MDIQTVLLKLRALELIGNPSAQNDHCVIGSAVITADISAKQSLAAAFASCLKS